MRLLVVTQYEIPHGGGLSSHVLDLIDSLKSAGHQVDLLENRAAKPHKLRRLLWMVTAGGRNERYSSRLVRGMIGTLAGRIRRMISGGGYHLIHCHDPVAGFAAHLAQDGRGSQDRIPVVETVHGPLVYETRMNIGRSIEQSAFLRYLWEIEQGTYHAANRLIAVDAGQARIVIEDFRTDREKVTVISNSVSCEALEAIRSSPPSTPSSKACVLVPRRLVRKTGVATAIQALSLLPWQSRPEMLIAGNGPLEEELRKLASSLGVSDSVRFLGSLPREEIIRLMNVSLAILVPSIPASGVIEATSIAAIEGMACGKVVIASAIGGLADTIADGQTGFLVPPGDAEALSRCLGTIVGNPELRDSIGRQARQFVLSELDTPVWVKKVTSVYEAALATNIERLP